MRSVAVSVLVVIALLATACGSDTSDDPPPYPNLVLLPSGIGRYTVGNPADEVIEGLSRQIGGFDADSLEEDSSVLVPDCDGLPTRLVSWGNLVLLFVTDGAAEVFHTWSYGFDPVNGNAEDSRDLRLETEEGLSLTSTRPELIDLYGARVTVVDNPAIDLASYTIDTANDEHLAGNLASVEPDARVQLIERVPNCEA